MSIRRALGILCLLVVAASRLLAEDPCPEPKEKNPCHRWDPSLCDWVWDGPAGWACCETDPANKAGTPYDPATQGCCYGSGKPSVVYTLATQDCCTEYNTHAAIIIKKDEEACCDITDPSSQSGKSTKVYKTATEICCGGYIQQNDYWFCCTWQGTERSFQKEFYSECCGNTAVQKKDPASLILTDYYKCCAEEILDTRRLSYANTLDFDKIRKAKGPKIPDWGPCEFKALEGVKLSLEYKLWNECCSNKKEQLFSIKLGAVNATVFKIECAIPTSVPAVFLLLAGKVDVIFSGLDFTATCENRLACAELGFQGQIEGGVRAGNKKVVALDITGQISMKCTAKVCWGPTDGLELRDNDLCTWAGCFNVKLIMLDGIYEKPIRYCGNDAPVF